MGIKAKNLHRGTRMHATRWCHFHREPPQDQDLVVVSTFSLDGVAAGTAVTLTANTKLPPGCQLFFGQTDAGFTAVVTYRIVGRDHLFRPTIEDVTISAVAAGGATSPVVGGSLACYSRVDSITIIAITGTGTGDSIVVGIDANMTASTGHNGYRIGVPLEVASLSGISLIHGGVAGGTSTVPITLSSFNANYCTAALAASGGTTGRNLYWYFDPEVLANL